jgi:hypothetical protein
LIRHTIRRFGDWHLDLTPPPLGEAHLRYHDYTRPTEDDRTKALNLLPTDR